MARAQKLPMVVFITQERDGDESYLVAARDIEFIDAGVVVGEYHLQATSKKRVDHSLDVGDE